MAVKVYQGIITQEGSSHDLALKLATGAGKTTVMAMLIAWQTVNAVRHPNSKKYSRGFLIVAPGLTIRARLRAGQLERQGDRAVRGAAPAIVPDERYRLAAHHFPSGRAAGGRLTVARRTAPMIARHALAATNQSP